MLYSGMRAARTVMTTRLRMHTYAHVMLTLQRVHCTLLLTALIVLQSPVKRIGEGFTSEEQVFEFLGLEYIPPEYRNC
jgi:DNA polymerase beta thumb